MNLSIKLPSVEQFYIEADKVEETGRLNIWEEMDGRNDPEWVGLSREKILESKFSYKEGLDNLKKIEEDLFLGGSRKKYKYDEFDGDDMNYDRFLEQMPAMKKRIRNHGAGQGKFINLHVCICENAWCSSESLMIRAYTVMRLVDYLEDQGYRIGVSVYTDTNNVGSYRGEKINLLHVEVMVKKPEETLIRPLILTSVSSWMFRFWMFKFRAAKFYVDPCMGVSASVKYTETKQDIYIGRGECLTTGDAAHKLRMISRLFNDDIEEED